MNLIDFARKPYPFNLSRWGVIISISLFVSFFMVVFQPFGLQNLDPARKLFLLTGYGLVTFIVLIIDMIIIPLIIPGIFREERWTVFKEIIWLIWILLTIAFGNYAYSFLFSIAHWVGIKGFFFFAGFTFAIGIIPIIGVTVFSYNLLLKKNLRASRDLNKLIAGKKTALMDDDNKEVITFEHKNNQIVIPASSLICIESEGNYVKTWYLEEGRMVHLIIRNTIKNIESQLQNADRLFKCHRAFILNLSYVKKVKGNSQGYRLLLKHIDKEIPVSRNYSKSFREAMGGIP